MISKPLVLTYFYLFIYILLSSGVILYNKVIPSSSVFHLNILSLLITGLNVYIYVIVIHVLHS